MNTEEIEKAKTRSLDDKSKVKPKPSGKFTRKLLAPTAEHKVIDLLEEELNQNSSVVPKSTQVSLGDLPQLPADLDTYTLTEVYAEGGTARVYKAFESHSKQRVAIKLLRRRFQNDLLIPQCRGKTTFLPLSTPAHSSG